MKATYHLALRTLRQRQVIKKNLLSQCMGCCKVQILASLLFNGLLLFGLTADDIGVLSIRGTSTGANVCEFSFHIVVL